MIKFSIVTPCFNSAKYLRETIESVLNQSIIKNKRANLQYIIIDADSKDHTSEIINSFNSDYITFISEKDNGMYDALSKGIRLSNGDIFAYINAGDIYHHKAFEIIDKVFDDKKINWVTGSKFIFNENSEITDFFLPFNFRKIFLQLGIYGTYLPFVQQESTFWRHSLNEDLDLIELKKFKFSGDSYIWSIFSKKNTLHIVNTFLAGFKRHENQMSTKKNGNINAHKLEQKKLIKGKFKKLFIYFPLLVFDLLFWTLSKYQFNIFKIFNKNFIKYNNVNKKWN
jgi:glycosyltransferase involved in cell wall biosynthesis